MLTVKQLRVDSNRHCLFQGLSFTLSPGEIWVLRGPNGSGKTTLLRLLAGLSVPQVGSIHYEASTTGDVLGTLIYLPHRPVCVPELTALENLQYLSTLGTGRVLPETLLRYALEYWGLASAAKQRAEALSQGQQQRLALARLLVQPAVLWLLDEPTNGLDVLGLERLWGLCDTHQRAGGSVLLATHLAPPAFLGETACRRSIELGVNFLQEAVPKDTNAETNQNPKSSSHLNLNPNQNPSTSPHLHSNLTVPTEGQHMSSLMQALVVCVSVEFKRVSRSLVDWGLSWVFFILVVSVFAIGMGGHVERFSVQQGTGILWVGAMLATLLSFERLFRPDFESRTLEQCLLSPIPLPILMAVKLWVHWLVAGLPLLLLTPLMLLFLGLPVTILPMMLATIAIGTQVLSALGSLGVVLTLGLKRAGVLLTVLLLPLYLPTLIFATAAITDVSRGGSGLGALYLLMAVWLMMQVLMPWVVAMTLRVVLRQ